MKEGQVVGPLERSKIESEARLNENLLIWGRGLGEWMSYPDWVQATAETQRESDEFKSHIEWSYRFGSDQKGPMSYDNMIAQLRKINRYENLELFSSELQSWKSIFALASVADHLGITRRRHPRVPIIGSLHFDVPLHPEQSQRFRVISISPGGLGLSDAKTLKLGEVFKATLSSANLKMNLHCQCEVVHAAANGTVGLQFIHLGAEAQAAIIEYVNKFEDLS